jgi:hypothetical protein
VKIVHLNAADQAKVEAVMMQVAEDLGHRAGCTGEAWKRGPEDVSRSARASIALGGVAQPVLEHHLETILPAAPGRLV